MNWELSNIGVTFGSTTALDGVDMAIQPGAIHSVIGGDGAGKSTLLKVLAGLDVGQSGSAHLPPQERIGFVPSSGGIFRDLTVSENLEFVAHAHHLRNWRPRADRLLERAALGSFSPRLSGRLSGGQRRKLAGAMALLAEPDLVVLDEVTTGLDPVSRMELWRLLAAAAADGAAIVASTTYLDEAERAELVLLLHEGRVLAAGTPTSITDSVRGTVTDRPAPTRRSLAWRRGPTWRQWDPDGVEGGTAISLEDAAIVFELVQLGRPR